MIIIVIDYVDVLRGKLEKRVYYIDNYLPIPPRLQEQVNKLLDWLDVDDFNGYKEVFYED